MAVELRRCAKCGRYSMRDCCQEEGAETKSVHPAKYSPQDKWALYRRMEKYPKLFKKKATKLPQS